MWKKLLLIFILCFCFTACSSEYKSIEGYWMAENGDTISFNSDGKAIIEGISYDYSIYDGNNLSISLWGFAQEYKFTIDKDVLTLTKAGSNSTQLFYKNEGKQAEIQENLNQIAANQEEQERIQQKNEQAQKEQKEYEKYISSLESRIDTIDSKIAEDQAWIVEIESWITEIDSNIAGLQQSDDMLADSQIDNLKDQQSRLCEDISELQQEITDLETEKEEIVKTLTELGEN